MSRSDQTPPFGREGFFLEVEAEAGGGGEAAEVAAVAAAVHVVILGAGHEFELMAVDVVVQAEVGGVVVFAAPAVGKVGGEALVAVLEAEAVAVAVGVLVAPDDVEFLGEGVGGEDVSPIDVALGSAPGGVDGFCVERPFVFF